MLEIRQGCTLDGRYTVHEQIGDGGHGVVWKAIDTELRRPVALKRLWNSGVSKNADLLEEAQKSAALVHQNIVQVYDIRTVEGESVLVMEYVEGPTLWSLLRQYALDGPAMPLDRFADVMRGLLDGISFAHGHRLCHRDLTPMNILIAADGTPKIVDFGIARPIHTAPHSCNSSHGGTGNPDFMAPEQMNGELGDFSSDLFMLGIIGYLALFGRHPFAHPSGLFTIKELICDSEYRVPRLPPPAHLSAVDKRLFREYSALVERLLQRERTARFSCATEAIAMLEAVRPGVECPACGETVPEQKFCGACGERLGEWSHQLHAEPTVPSTATEAIDLGFEASRRQEWDTAVRFYRHAIQLDPTCRRAYANLGYALNHLGQYEEAVDVLTKGFDLPSAAPAHDANFLYARSFALERLKRFEEALYDVDRAIARAPTRSYRNLFQRAKLHLSLGQHAEATEDARVVLSQWPDHPGAQSVLKQAAT